MTLYNVHLYREMRLFYPGIEAATPEQAAQIAAGKPTDEADAIEDCNGENLAALIDVSGDDDFTYSVTIDFEPERLRKAAAETLAALQWFEAFWRRWAERIRRSPTLAANCELLRIYEAALAAITKAGGAGQPSATTHQERIPL